MHNVYTFLIMSKERGAPRDAFFEKVLIFYKVFLCTARRLYCMEIIEMNIGNFCFFVVVVVEKGGAFFCLPAKLSLSACQLGGVKEHLL